MGRETEAEAAVKLVTPSRLHQVRRLLEPPACEKIALLIIVSLHASFIFYIQNHLYFRYQSWPKSGDYILHLVNNSIQRPFSSGRVIGEENVKCGKEADPDFEIEFGVI